MVATTVFVVVLITEILFEPLLAIYANPAFKGVAVIVAVTGLAPVFIAVKAAILPVPLAARPIPGVSLVQLIVLAVPVKFTAVVTLPFTNVWLATEFTVGNAVTLPVTPTV